MRGFSCWIIEKVVKFGVEVLPKFDYFCAMQPLAERLRPQNLDDYIGQKHLVGENAVLRNAPIFLF